MSAKKICFVIMGFGMKTDFETGKTIDLDKTYHNIIKPAAMDADFECVRADEVDDSGLIDRSMYALLLRADVVVADISTNNPNALYELGVRHAARPYSTIIIRDKSEKKIPFDLDHTRIFHYEHLGKDIGADEAKRCVASLSAKMRAVSDHQAADSPMYEMLTTVQPPVFSEEEFNEIVTQLASREKSIFALRAAAEASMTMGDFTDAAEKWAKAAELSDGDSYFIQQQALSTYKAHRSVGITAFTDALAIIKKLQPDMTNDPETLGITGAIYKNLFLATGDTEALERATKYYKHGFVVVGDYYTGENYANCLDLQLDRETDPEVQTYLKIESKRTRLAIIEKLGQLEKQDVLLRPDAIWIFASLSNCYRAVADDERAEISEKDFRDLNPLEWQIETFENTKNTILKRR